MLQTIIVAGDVIPANFFVNSIFILFQDSFIFSPLSFPTIFISICHCRLIFVQASVEEWLLFSGNFWRPIDH